MKSLLLIVLLAAGTSTTTKPRATPKPKATAKAKATPVKPDEPAVSSGERALTKGEATFKLGVDDKKLDEVKGSIQSSGGYQIASVAFTRKSARLQLDFMFVGTGPVDQITSLYALDEDGASTVYRKGMTTCVVTLDEASPLTVAGTASCPKGMLALDDKPGKPLTNVKFRASAE